MATTDQRLHLVGLMGYLISKEPKIHYDSAGIRPMKNIHYYEQDLANFLNSAAGSITADCSESITLLCKLAGLKDPTGNDYNGYGNSSDMFNTLPKPINPVPHPGALIVFGPGGVDHVAMCMDVSGLEVMLFSHGSEGGPRRVSLSAEIAAHRAPATWLSAGSL